MIEANFSTGMDELRIPALTQWDKHQKLTISGLGLTDSVFHVHFANAKSEEAIVRMAYLNDGVYEVDIPNSLLEEKHTIYAYLYLIEYETAVVDSATEGSYYTKSGEVYTKVTLPAEYATGVTYYKQKGKTVKTVIIPVKPRKKPDGYISEDPTDEELIDELMRYCNNLGHRLDYYTNLVNEYRSKDLVRLVSRAEYDALVTANKLETGVIYCIKNEDTLDAMVEIVTQQVSEGLTAGTIVVGKVEEAEHADRTSIADRASIADTANVATSIYAEICSDTAPQSNYLVVNGAGLYVVVARHSTGKYHTGLIYIPDMAIYTYGTFFAGTWEVDGTYFGDNDHYQMLFVEYVPNNGLQLHVDDRIPELSEWRLVQARKISVIDNLEAE